MLRLSELEQQNIPYRWRASTAIASYLKQEPGNHLFLTTDADVVQLATLFSSLEFTGIDGYEAVINYRGYRLFVLSDSPAEFPAILHPAVAFGYDPRTDQYYDPGEVYPDLRALRRGDPVPISGILDADLAAIMVARFPFDAGTVTLRANPDEWPETYQRMILSQVLTGPNAQAGIEILAESGALFSMMPELSRMRETAHSKEGHPEGDVWRHTLETFRYRKNQDLTVSLALLLHDIGKPYAQENNGRRFDHHAEIGSDISARILGRLGFCRETIEAVGWLIRNHMIPGAIEALPAYRRNRTMSSPLFPQLLELYRCDLSSTFRGPDGYYRACTIYRKYLKDVANPFRNPDGKKTLRLYVE